MVNVLHPHANSFDGKQRTFVDKVKRKLDFELERKTSSHLWSDLKSFEDLQKLRVVLETNFEKVTTTLIELLPELLEKTAGKDNTILIDFWNCVVTAAKVAIAKKEKKEDFTVATTLLSKVHEMKIFSAKQKKLVEDFQVKLK